MNAGAYGGEMKDVLVEATVLDTEGNVRTLKNEELELGYRHSIVKEKNYIVLEAVIELKKGSADSIKAVMDDLREKRVSTNSRWTDRAQEALSNVRRDILQEN